MYKVKNNLYFYLLGIFSFIRGIYWGGAGKMEDCSVFIICPKGGRWITFQMYTQVKVKISDNIDYRNKDKKD